MKRLAVVFLVMSTLALAEDKPRVFVQGKGSEDVSTNGSGVGGRHWAAWGSKSSIDSHDEGMEVTKDLQKNCSAVVVTLNQANADYTVMLNRESKQNRGLLRANSQVQVANRLGDVLGTSATRSVENAAKDACQLILADWSQRRRTAVSDSPTPAPAVARVAPSAASAPGGAKLETVSAVETQPATAAASTASATTTDQGDASLGETAKRARQHKACLELAKDNPAIVCK